MDDTNFDTDPFDAGMSADAVMAAGAARGLEVPDGLTATSGKTRRAPLILAALAEEHDDAEIALRFDNVFELLIVTMLSAQSTDVKVNEISPALFDRFPNPFAMAEATREELEGLVGQLGLFRQKAKNIQATARILVTEHDGEVPADMDALTALPGVARKTANVVLSNGFGRNVGVVVDTHVTRLARRLRFTKQTTATRIERDLMRLFPERQWLDVSDLLIFHGRRVCTARNRACARCVVAPLCPSDATANRTDKA